MCRPDGRHVFFKGKVQMITYLRLFNRKFHEKKSIKLNIGGKIYYEDSIYTVVAVIYTTVYLRAVNDDSTNYD